LCGCLGTIGKEGIAVKYQVENQGADWKRKVWILQTIYEVFLTAAQSAPEGDFVISDTGRYSYQQSLEMVDQMTKGLRILGVQAGSHVALLAENSEWFVFLTLAIAKLGAVKVPVNSKLRKQELKHVLSQSDTDFLLTELPLWEGWQKDLPRIRACIAMCREAEEITESIPWAEFLELASSGGDVRMEGGPHDMADIIYTSGSTGAPKGVMLTHDKLLRASYANCINRRCRTGQRIYIPLPLYHVYGYVEGLLAALLTTGAIIITKERFTAEKAVELMQRHRATDILSVPSQMIELLQSTAIPEGGVTELTSVYCAASTCPPWVWEEIRKKLGVQEVITGYGMTETSGAVVQTDPFDSTIILSKKVGKVLMGGSAGDTKYANALTEYKVVDQHTGEDLPGGMVGELVCRGATIFNGYYNAEAATASALSDGWLHTGDLGWIDEDGYLELLGRINDSYKINGENVSPQFLDRIAVECEQIAAVEFVGIPHEKFGAVGVAFIEAVDDSPETERKVLHHLKEHLAKFQMPKYVFFTPRRIWPKTASGKVIKFRLREMALQILADPEEAKKRDVQFLLEDK